MGLYHVGFHVSYWGCGWGQNIDGCSPLCFSAVQDEQRRAPRTTTSKNISGLAALGCAAGSTQNNGFKSFLKFLCGNYLPNSWVEFKLEGVSLSLAWLSSAFLLCRTTTSKNISGLAALGLQRGAHKTMGSNPFLNSFVAIICLILELSSNLRVCHWVWHDLQDHNLEKFIWICCYPTNSPIMDNKQLILAPTRLEPSCCKKRQKSPGQETSF